MRQWMVLTLLGLLSVTVFAKELPRQYSLDIEYTRHGKQLCRTQIVADVEEWYVVCGLDGAKNSIMDLRVSVEQIKDSAGQTMVAAKMTEIDPVTGILTLISNPRIAVLDHETSNISQSEIAPDGTELPTSSFSVTVRPR